jgi:hypothetical protein
VAGVAEVGHLLSGAVPMLNQPNELMADTYGTNNVLTAGSRRQGYRFTEDSDLDCLLESEPSGQGLVDALAAAAGAVSTLRIVTRVCSGCAFGSDHVPYLDRGIPAVLSIENDWDDYPHYHQATDLPSELSLVMGGEVLKMEAAALAELTGAGGPVALFADGFESGDLGAWSAAVP